MTIKPILFNADMVRAILEGQKAVTRRVVRPQPPDNDPHNVCFNYIENGTATFGLRNRTPHFVKLPYQPGDILYVRETWKEKRGGGYLYKADTVNSFDLFITPDGRVVDEIPWCPSIHMPKDAARIFLRVTGVRVERLQSSFTEPICPILELQAEGVDIGDICQECIEDYGEPCCVDTVDGDGTDISECGILDEVRGEFSDLWDSTIKTADRDKYGWAANPWCWVIQFERCGKPEVQV